MGRLDELVIDTWSPLSYKTPFQGPGGMGLLAAQWMPDDDRRRLTAYTVLAAYDANTARVFLDSEDDRREYGDAALVVDQVMAYLLGEDQAITVPAAEDYDPDLPEQPGDGDDPAEHAEAVARNEEARRATAVQDVLREWAARENLPLKVLDCERKAVAQGDGVYLIAWSAEKHRPVVTVIDPGFYFPVLPTGLDAADYPTRVHLAWEIPAEHTYDGKKHLRRVTYELGPIAPAGYTNEQGGWLSRLFTGEGEPVLADGDRYDELGRIVRAYPWTPTGETSAVTCYLTDAEWVLDDTDGSVVDQLTPDTATIHANGEGELLDRLDLRIDFLPVIHIPNTPAGAEHYGQSSLARVLQVLDDLSATDTDSQSASATTGSPIIGMGGVQMARDATGQPKPLTLKPGSVFGLGEHGTLTALDTSANLRELRAQVEALRDRLSTNSRLPDVALGTVKETQALSGVALRIKFGPLEAMVRAMRRARAPKYALLLKFAQRLMMLDPGYQPPAGGPVVFDAELAFGSYLPSDEAAAVSTVREGVEAGVISLETGVRMLLEAGLPIEDVAEEVRRIESRDFDGANKLADATNDQAAVRDYLGMPAAASVPVTPVLPAD